MATFAGRSVCPNAKCNGVRFRLSTLVLLSGYASASSTNTSSDDSLAHAFFCIFLIVVVVVVVVVVVQLFWFGKCM